MRSELIVNFLKLHQKIMIVGVVVCIGCSKSSGVKVDSETALDKLSDFVVKSDSDSKKNTTLDSSSDPKRLPDFDSSSDSKLLPDLKDGTIDTANINTDTSGLLKLGFEWIEIEGGSFEMGSGIMVAPDGVLPMTFTPEGPIHTVSLLPFKINKSEISIAQYKKCIDAKACRESTALTDHDYNTTKCSEPYENINNWLFEGRQNHPVNCIDFLKATDFCNWVGGKLPTEAQWEYAARSRGMDKTYPWGKAELTCDLAVFYDNILGKGCGTGMTEPICSKEAGNTEQGLCDIIGNIAEMTQDDYHLNYENAPTDGSAWLDDPSTSIKVARGASWGTSSSLVKISTTSRSSIAIQHSLSSVGFRCVK